MAERDGWKHDHDGFWGPVPAEFPVTEADRAAWPGGVVEEGPEAAEADANPYRKLPPRVAVDDAVGEVDTSTPPFDPAGDPNREVANHWGAGMAGF
jgi:hypothetical protein